MSTQWIDALEFENYGGFHPETQFVQEMGQGYLFALELPGVPVKTASTHFNIPEKGMYRIWVRTKNWYKAASPGRLKVLSDGDYLPRELGTLPTEQWCWEPAGDRLFTPGRHELAVEDTTGYFGRFAAVIITDDMDFTPEHKMERLWKERAALRGEPLEPVFRGNWDVVVAGGGPAGVPAAIAAARKGMRVALLHSRPGLGGNASDEGTVGFDGAYCHHVNMRETGIAEEIRRIRDHEHLTWEGALRRLAEAEPNLEIFYNQFVIDADSRDGHIRSLSSIDSFTGLRYTYGGKMFIDCTGDGWAGYWAGAKYRLGREAKWQYNEPQAPEAPDNLTMSGCLMGSVNSQQILGYYAEDAGEPTPFNAPDWAIHLPEALYREPGRLHTGEWWVENPTDMDDLWEQEAIRDELLRLNLGYFHWLKNHYHRRDLARNLKITAFGRYNARRENRRLMGDYVLTENDCREGKTFPDAISYCGWPLDVHHPRGLYSGAEGPFYSNNSLPVTEIPYRCIYSKNIDNLLMAGRCASVSHLALGTVRVQNTLATLGQAAGTAAWLAIVKNTTPRGLYENHMEELQQILTKDDQYIPSFTASDPRNLAPMAKISASSFSKAEFYRPEKGVTGGWMALDTRRIASIPVNRPLEFARAYLKNTGEAAVLTAKSFSMPGSGQYEKMTQLEEVSAEIPTGFEGYLDFPLTQFPEKGGYGLLIEPAPGVFWREMLFCSDGRRRGEPINAYRWSTDNSNSLDAQFFTQVWPVGDCRPENTVKGPARIAGADNCGWVSDPAEALPQSITFTFDQPETVGQVRLAFDTDLTNPSYSYLSQPNVAKTVRDYFVEVLAGGAWQTVAQVEGNYTRFHIHRFPAVSAEAVRVTVTATNGDPSARIFDIRIYSEEE